MKLNFLMALLLACPSFMAAQTKDDPTLLTVNGIPVTRSEFEYSYNKNNAEGVVDKKSVEEYVELFVNYKLKVAEALNQKLDTLGSFRKEFAQHRNQQVRPSFVSDADVERKAQEIYSLTKKNIGPDGLVKVAHICLRLPQKADAAQQAAIKARIDSIYTALKGGADFTKLAAEFSQDYSSANNGGEMPWISRGQWFKEFTDVAFALKTGEMSQPVQTPAGYHIILKKGQKDLEPYETLRSDILSFIEKRNLREAIAQANVDSIAKASGGKLTPDDVMAQRTEQLSENDPELKNLIREYHDGLLLYEVSNRTVWEKASKDEAGLAAYFKKNKKKYAWTEPRFKGIVYHVKQQDDVKAVAQCVKGVPFADWNEKLRLAFNADSVLRIRAEKGIFKKGDNALVDKEQFGVDSAHVKLAYKDYPIEATYGKLLKKGPEEYTDVIGQVTADYQDLKEKEWVEELRKKYPVEIDREVLKTVNNHGK